MSKLTALKMRWARKLMLARYFVLLTDKESVIALEGVDPDSFVDLLALTAQAAEVEDFHRRLGLLVEEHNQALKRLTKEVNAVTKKQPKTAKKRTR